MRGSASACQRCKVSIPTAPPQAPACVSTTQQLHCEQYLLPLLSSHAGIVSKFTGAQGVVGMHGGLPPPDAFPFASLGGNLAPDPSCSSSSTPHADAGPSSSAATVDGVEVAAGQQQAAVTQRLDITDPSLVALAQQYIMTPKVSACVWWWWLNELRFAVNRLPVWRKDVGPHSHPTGCGPQQCHLTCRQSPSLQPTTINTTHTGLWPAAGLGAGAGAQAAPPSHTAASISSRV